MSAPEILCLQWNSVLDGVSTNFPFLVAQILNITLLIAWPVLVFKGIRTVRNHGNGSEVPLWMILILLFPIVGAWITLSYFAKRKPSKVKG